MRTKSRFLSVALLGGLATAATTSSALPVLTEGKFFADSSIFSESDWSYTGTLPTSLNAGFKAKNIDDDFFGDSGTYYVTGSRSMTSSTAAATPSYNLSLRGEFEKWDETIDISAWRGSLLDQSKGTRPNDIDKIEFPAPGGGITNEKPIPSDWASLDGYANSPGTYAKFDRTYTLSRSYLDPGEFGCPQQNTGHCTFTEAYFIGGADLQANLQGSGSLEIAIPGTQSVNINAKANRITTFKVNDAPVYSGTVNGSASTFTLEEEKVKSVDFSFSVNFATETVDIGADVQWDGRGDTASFDASYVHSIVMAEYVNVGFANQYFVEVRDNPQLSAGINGTDFYKSSVLASTGLGAIDVALKPVFQPLTSGHLSVKDAKVTNKASLLEIPDGGFVNDRFLRFNIGIVNDGYLDINVDDIAISIFDDDILFDDLLATFMRDNLDLMLAPGQMFDFAFNVDVTADALNNAVSLLEGDFLELKAEGRFSFSDTFGKRTKEFSARFVPEPNALLLMLGTLPLIFFRRNSRRQIDASHERIAA